MRVQNVQVWKFQRKLKNKTLKIKNQIHSNELFQKSDANIPYNSIT